MKSALYWRVLSSFKAEIRVVSITLAALMLLPLLAVLVVVESGLSAVSDALAAFNPVTHRVEVRDPDGNIMVELDATTTWPVRGYVSLEFGERSPIQQHHSGIDIANPNGEIGDPVTTIMAGKVTKIDARGESGYGKYVLIDHGHNVTSLYGHLWEVSVTEGQEVVPGDIIGLEGETGFATGPHVHLEIRVYGIPVNPRIFLVGDPVR